MPDLGGLFVPRTSKLAHTQLIQSTRLRPLYQHTTLNNEEWTGGLYKQGVLRGYLGNMLIWGPGVARTAELAVAVLSGDRAGGGGRAALLRGRADAGLLGTAAHHVLFLLL